MHVHWENSWNRPWIHKCHDLLCRWYSLIIVRVGFECQVVADNDPAYQVLGDPQWSISVTMDELIHTHTHTRIASMHTLITSVIIIVRERATARPNWNYELIDGSIKLKGIERIYPINHYENPANCVECRERRQQWWEPVLQWQLPKGRLTLVSLCVCYVSNLTTNNHTGTLSSTVYLCISDVSLMENSRWKGVIRSMPKKMMIMIMTSTQSLP